MTSTSSSVGNSNSLFSEDDYYDDKKYNYEYTNKVGGWLMRFNEVGGWLMRFNEVGGWLMRFNEVGGWLMRFNEVGVNVGCLTKKSFDFNQIHSNYLSSTFATHLVESLARLLRGSPWQPPPQGCLL